MTTTSTVMPVQAQWLSEWCLCRRPTFLPEFKQKQLNRTRVMADPSTRVLASYINALADLAQPKASIPLLHDDARLNAYQAALAGAVHELPGDVLTAVMPGLMACSLCCTPSQPLPNLATTPCPLCPRLQTGPAPPPPPKNPQP